MELSEKELENEYKKFKMMDVPPMWDDIERNLAPKKRKRKVVPIRRIASIAAIFAAVLILVPAAYVIRRGQSGDGYSGAASENIQMETAESTDAGGVESAEEAMVGGLESGGEAAAGGVESGGEVVAGGVESAMEAAEDTAGGDGAQGNVEAQRLTIQVWGVAQAKEGEAGIVITGELLESSDSSLMPGEKVSIAYDGADYQPEDFSGTLTLKVKKEEEALKLLEILP